MHLYPNGKFTSTLYFLNRVVILVFLFLILSSKSASSTTPPDFGESKAPDFIIYLPWRTNQSVGLSYTYGGDWSAGTHYGSDYYALDFVLNENEQVYPIADGTVLFAGRATGGFCDYGNFVFIDHGTYQSFYAHLNQTLVNTGEFVDISRAIGKVGGTRCANKVPYGSHLHLVLRRGARLCSPLIHCTGYGPFGGIAVVPEPIIGREVYEGFGLRWSTTGQTNPEDWLVYNGIHMGWAGPFQFTDIHIDSVAGSPVGNWGAGSTVSGSTIAVNQPVNFVINGLSSDTKEVRFTTGYYDWSVMDNHTDNAVWRILARCWPDRQSASCTWSNNNTSLSFSWYPYSDNLETNALWLPSGSQYVHSAFNNSVNQQACISFDVFDTAGNVSYAPSGTQCAPVGGVITQPSFIVFLPLVANDLGQAKQGFKSDSNYDGNAYVKNSFLAVDSGSRTIYIAPSNISLPTATSTRIPNDSTPTATPGPGLPADSWYVDYFSDQNLDSKCNPQTVTLFENPPQRTYLFKDWGDGAPYSGCPNDFSSRMWRSINFTGGDYSFHLFADDKAKLFVDGNLVVDQWNSTQHNESRTLSAGNHDLKVEFQDSGGAARVHFWWDGPGFPAPPHATKDPNQWYASFWPNTEWFWDPFMTYNDGNPLPLDKIWGIGGAGYGLQNDNFSSTYERTYRFDCGDYRFDLNADDYAELDIFDLDTNQPVHHLVTVQANNLVQSDSPVKLLGKNYEVRVKYKEFGGDARLYVNWKQLSSCPTPTSTHTPTNTPLPTDTPTPPPTATYTPKPTPTFTPVPQVHFSSSQFTVNEGGGSATISVNLNSPSAQTITVNYTTGDQTATAGSDYVTTSGSLIFNPGQTSQSFTVPILDDITDEPDETVMITLNNAANAILGSPNKATVIIIDNDESGPSCNTITQISRSECEALKVFYTSLNGEVVLDAWFTSETPCTNWLGIVCSAGHVTRLELGDWNLQGSIPPEIGNLTYLERLDLDYNNSIVGSIPTELGNLTKLTVLRLSNTQLSGSVPLELGNLGNLHDLLLSDTLLSGPLPLSLVNLAKLEWFWYQDTNLCEPIDPALHVWVDSIGNLRGTGLICGSPPAPPSAPVNLQAIPLSSTEIKLTWADTSRTEVGFFIDEGSITFPIYEVNTTTYTHSGLAPNSYHCYHMYAFNDFGNSSWTDWVCAETLP